jgi:aminoglycoside phosphotransferase (APT) family kinase protein
MADTDELLNAETVLPYLRGRGVIGAGTAQADELGGGVSNVVLAVTCGETGLVLKQALPRLRVAGEWLAKRERALVEARALGLALALAPGAAPRVLDVDEERCAIAIELAPAGRRAWKDLLLVGEVDPGVAADLGRLLGIWHGDPAAAAAFDEWDSFVQLRIDPYYLEVARRHPELAADVLGYADAMAERRCAFVHGDFSPKNVLVGDGALWVIDFEVAHRGDPAFDVAFLTTHLVLKGIARPTCRDALWQCIRAFHESYAAATTARPPLEPAYVLGHVGCLLLARVDGKSPAEYLDEPERGEVRALATRLIRRPPAGLGELFAELEESL